MSSKPVPRLPGGPEPGQPVPRTPVDGMDLAACATVAAQLAAGIEARAATLARAGLNEARWASIEKTWMLRIAAALLEGDQSLNADFDAAFSAAQASFSSDPERPLDAYAALVAALEDGREPAVVFAGAGLSIGAFMRLQRAWTARLSRDEALAATFRSMVDARRAPP